MSTSPTAVSARRFAAEGARPAFALVAAVVLALVWANASPASYRDVWATTGSLALGSHEVALPLREWVDSGLMTFFFFLVGLEARRELDLGELRRRSRIVLPLVVGLVAMTVPALVFAAVASSGGASGAWGVAMSTDSAFALGVLALAGRGPVAPVRAFLLTVLVVDDVAALLVITTVYSREVDAVPLAGAVAVFGVALVARARRVRSGWVYAALAACSWLLLLVSGVETVVIGLAAGLVVYAWNPPRDVLEEAHERFVRFREQPTPDLAQQAQRGLAASVSRNDRLRLMYEPWVDYAVVPLFAVANAGVDVHGGVLVAALTSPVALGVVAGYVLGKPAGYLLGAAAVTAVTRGRLRPPVGWAAVLGAGAVSGIGFTVSLLVADIALDGVLREQAVTGVLVAAALSSVLTWLVFATTTRLPATARARLLLGSAQPLVDLTPSVDDDVDHVRGAADAAVTVVEYGDYECEFCGRAEPQVRGLLAEDADIRFVWRHLPLDGVHPRARLAAQASEAAALQGAFWPMHDLLLERQQRLSADDLVGYAADLGLDVARFARDLGEDAVRDRVEQDVGSADLSGVAGTPSFFVNGRRHYGSYDTAELLKAVKLARARSAVAAGR